MVDNLRVTRLLVNQCSLLSLVNLPYAINLIVPNLAYRLADVPAVACIVDFVAILVILIVEMLDGVLVVRETCRGVPCEIFCLDVCLSSCIGDVYRIL